MITFIVIYEISECYFNGYFSVEAINFLTPLEDITLNEIGLEAEFSCTITKENMKPEWYKGDLKLKRSDVYEMATDSGTTHKLLIHKANVEEEGEYIVKFREDVKTSAKLMIKGKCFELKKHIQSCFIYILL